MIRTGIFVLVNGESRLNDGTLLAVCSDPSPLAAARPFLLGRQCREDHWVQVSGTTGAIGGAAVFCLTGAQPVAPPVSQPLVAAAEISKRLPTKRKRRQKRPTKSKKTTKGKAKGAKKSAKTARKKRPQ